MFLTRLPLQYPLKCSWSHRQRKCTLTSAWVRWCFEALWKREHSPAVIISNKLYMQKYSEFIITLQGHIHESRGCNLCPVQTEELLETASTKTPIGKIQRHFTKDDIANWAFRIYTQSILSYHLSHSYLPWKSSERGSLLCRTEDHKLQHSP